ncbi:hypothetical protein DAEQUDRAFT_307216 [Daedalea quercina L-15889]|uniref:Uncharacterized protein n=1 Tax=Daedalea quercina L-15889 TaxID=1314783 RepID=A0A165Q2Y0_9APHY|nr:hypothetical protein DAEQUDRAFT_307216 [Daedalea quercina L-15889]
MIPQLTANSGKTEQVERRRPVFRPPPRMATGSDACDAPPSDTSGADDFADGEYRKFKPMITVYMPLSPVSSPAQPADTTRHCARASLPSPPSSDPVLVGGTGPEEPLAFREALKIRFAGMKRRIAEVRTEHCAIFVVNDSTHTRMSTNLDAARVVLALTRFPSVAQASVGTTMGSSRSP